MGKDTLWLTEGKEKQPYICNAEKYVDKIELIKTNKQIVDKIYSNNPLTAQEIEKCAIIKASIGAPMLEDGDAREKMPPYTDEFKSGHKAIIGGFEEAQSDLFYYLEMKDLFGNRKFPILEHTLLPFIYQKLVKDNEDLSRKEKNGFRETDSIQLSFCQPTKASEITSEVGSLFVEYVNSDVNWADLDAERPVNFENIAKAHAQFVRIQPFNDGNKRMAFILTNGMLKLQGLSPIAICETKEESERYMQALKNAIVNRDATDLADYFADCQLSAQREIINAATISAVESKILYANKPSYDDPDAPTI